MKIQLNQVEIEAAVRDYIAAQGISLIGKDVEVSFTSGRADRGLTADLDIVDAPAAGAVVPSRPVLAVDNRGPVAEARAAIQGEHLPFDQPSNAERTGAESVNPPAAKVAEETSKPKSNPFAEGTGKAEVAEGGTPFKDEAPEPAAEDEEPGEVPAKSVSLFS